VDTGITASRPLIIDPASLSSDLIKLLINPLAPRPRQCIERSGERAPGARAVLALERILWRCGHLDFAK
jgi:hypothetical protein